MLRWLTTEPSHDHDEPTGDLVVHADARTDWFNDPRTGERTGNAPVGIVIEGQVPVTVACRVELDSRSTFDAGCLFAYEDDDHWIKLALELDPSGQRRVVTVVTNVQSDDCNHATVTTDHCDLRVTLDRVSYALHARTEGDDWHLVRYGPSPFRNAPAIGVEAQSPTGDGVTARFGRIDVRSESVVDLRNGS